MAPPNQLNQLFLEVILRLARRSPADSICPRTWVASPMTTAVLSGRNHRQPLDPSPSDRTGRGAELPIPPQQIRRPRKIQHERTSTSASTRRRVYHPALARISDGMWFWTVLSPRYLVVADKPAVSFRLKSSKSPSDLGAQLSVW